MDKKILVFLGLLIAASALSARAEARLQEKCNCPEKEEI